MPRVDRIASLTLVTADLARACAFYAGALGFERVAARSDAAGETAMLRLGGESIDLFQPVSPGAAYPAVRAANDPWFQHFAIAVSDMPAAYARLADSGSTPISTAGPILLPPSSGSVTAYKFRDPDGHPLELSFFASGPWTTRQPAGGPFLGIDHTAVAVGDLEASVGFYCGTLGFSETFRGLNRGATQDALDGLAEAVVDIVVLEAAARTGLHLELLHYRSPRPPVPIGFGESDIVATKIRMLGDAPPGTLRDPDGHFIGVGPA